MTFVICCFGALTLLHSERPKLYAFLVFLSALGLRNKTNMWKENYKNDMMMFMCSYSKAAFLKAQLIFIFSVEISMPG